jgi:N-acetylglutamate synthase-like GNAT family acetyltransferase
MNKNIIVKEFASEYQWGVVDLILNIQQDEYQIPITKDDQPDLFNIHTYYQRGSGNFWVALHDEQVVGTISLLDIGEGQAALRKMFVNKGFRGKEYNTAKVLLNKAIAWAKQNSICTIYLGTTLQFVAAQRFYEKNGFELVPEELLPTNFPVMRVDKKFYKYVV